MPFGFQHFQDHLMARLIAKFLGNPAFLAAAAILRPFSRNVQPHIHQRMFAPRDVAHEDSHLAILDLSQSSAPLSRDGDRMPALLGKRRRVENDYAVWLSQFLTHLARQFFQQGLIIPGGCAQECLQSLPILVVAISDRLGVLSLHVGQQALQVHASMGSLLWPSQPRCERLGELVQPLRHTGEHRRMHLAIGQQLGLPQLKTSLHRLPPSSGKSVRKAFIQTDLRLVNTG
jgi:hypothetical protein